MRKARDAAFLIKDDVVVGINLGADFCAEHEGGLGSLGQDFGLPERTTRKVYGIKRRTATKQHPGLRLVTYGKYTYLVAMPEYRWQSVNCREDLDRFMEVGPHHDDEELVTAWAPGIGSGEFAIRVSTPDGASKLQELYSAANRKKIFMANPDIAIAFGGGGPFENSGLTLLIPSRIPAEILESMAARDLDHLDLRDAAEATGIEAKLKAAGKKWFALTPGWASWLESTRDGEVETAHKVVFFLNPIDQRNNNCGWYTVEQLEQWAEDKGPIPAERKHA